MDQHISNKWLTDSVRTLFSLYVYAQTQTHKNIKINSAHRKFIASALGDRGDEQTTNKILFLYVNTILSSHNNNIRN